MNLKQWSTSAADNDDADSTITWTEGQAPSTVNNSARAMMARLRGWYEDAEWIDLGHTLSMNSGTKFTVGSADRKAIYAAERRLKAVTKAGGADSTIYGKVSAVTFSAETAVTAEWDSGTLSSTLSILAVGIINPLNDSLPATVTAGLSDSSVTTVKIVDGAVTEAKLASDAVTADKIAAGAVGSSEIATGAVDTDELAADAVTAAKIAAGAVGSSEIATGAVDTAELAADAVTSAKIAAGAVGSSEIASGAVDTAELASDAVTADKIAAGAVGSSEIAAAAVGESEISNSSVSVAKIKAGTNAPGATNFLRGDGAWETPGGGGWEELETLAGSAASSVTTTAALENYDIIRIHGSVLMGSNVEFQFNLEANSTFQTGNLYNHTTATISSGGGQVSTDVDGVLFDATGAAGRRWFFEMIMLGGKRTGADVDEDGTCILYRGGVNAATSSRAFHYGKILATHADVLANAITAIRFQPASGTIDLDAVVEGKNTS